MERLPCCLEALSRQLDRSGKPLAVGSFGVIMFANNCRDGSAVLARSLGSHLSLKLRIIEATFPPAHAHAGNARRGAMDAAAQWLDDEANGAGVILSTDADSRVSPTWIEDNLDAIDQGVDAAFGTILLDEEGDALPQALQRRGRLESLYGELLTETSARIDPIAHDPWPRHSTISGATLAVTRSAYLRIGGLPAVPLGEDKALAAALMRIDAKIRHSNEIVVTTSGRQQGRAPGGVADTLRFRSMDPSAPCDEALEPYAIAFLRANVRRQMRQLYKFHDPLLMRRMSKALMVAHGDLAGALMSATFGMAWEEIERRSPRLFRRGLNPGELPRELLVANRIISRLRKRRSTANQTVETKARMAVAEIQFPIGKELLDEGVGGGVAG